MYFGTADALARGVVPYRDFVSVHPPGSILLLTATTGPLTAAWGPRVGFVAARVLAALAGAVTTWLLYRCAVRLAGRRAAVLSSMLYATFAAAVLAEGLVLLDPFMVVLAVGGATVFLERRTTISGVATGVLFGLSVTTKLTGAVFLIAALVVGLLVARERRRTLVTGAVAAATFAALSLPFVVLAGGRDWFDQVVMAQLDRPTGADLPGNIGTIGGRLSALVAWGPLGARGPLPGAIVVIGTIVLAAAIAWGVARAWRRDERAAYWTIAAVLAVAGLLVGPTFYAHYAVLAAVPFAVLLGGMASAGLDRLRRPRVATGVVTIVALVLAGWQIKVTLFVEPPSVPPAVASAISGLAESGCVYLDQPQIGYLSDVVPQDGVARPLVDPFGELLELGRTSSHSALEAVWSSPSQERLRDALDACGWIALATSPDGQFTWSPDTRAWFLATREPVGMADGYTIWRTPAPTTSPAS